MLTPTEIGKQTEAYEALRVRREARREAARQAVEASKRRHPSNAGAR